jgi:pimeloyl-ACP methyl ester carboxylesterase
MGSGEASGYRAEVWREPAGQRPRPSLRTLHPRVRVPTLHVWGSGDLALEPRATITTGRWATGAYRFEVLAGGGHSLPEHHIGELGRLLLEHLRRWNTQPAAAGGRAR